MPAVRVRGTVVVGALLVVALAATAPRGLPLFGQMPELLPPEETVVQVRVEGNGKIPVRKAMRHIRTRAGRPFNVETVEDDVRRLARSGMFVDVKPFYRKVPGGRIVIFEVVQRPTLTYIRFVGNEKMKAKKLLEESGLKVGDALDPYAIREAKDKIEAYYRQKGFNKVHVAIVEGNDPDDSGARFLINEGPKARILRANFVGNTFVSAARLKTQIESKPGFLWYLGGEVDDQKIEQDVAKLELYYKGLGFRDAKVSRIKEFNRNQDWLTLTFVINEGPRYQIRQVHFEGNEKYTIAELAEELELVPQEPFSQPVLVRDVNRIREKYGADGHIRVKVNPELRYLEEPNPRHELDIVYNIEEGYRYRVGRINVQIDGPDPHTRITTVLNRMSLQPGDIVDLRELKNSERRLRYSGLFLNDIAMGVVPQIEVAEPVADGPTAVARQPKRPPGARGQSPDPQYVSFVPDRPLPTGPRDRLIDVTVGEQPMPPASVPPQRVRQCLPYPQYPQRPPQPPRSPAEVQPDFRRPVQPPPSEPWPPNLRAPRPDPAVRYPRPTVVRGQSGVYDPNGALTTPPYPTGDPALGAQPYPYTNGGRRLPTDYYPAQPGPQPGQAPRPAPPPAAWPPASAPSSSAPPSDNSFTQAPPADNDSWLSGPPQLIQPGAPPVGQPPFPPGGLLGDDSPFLRALEDPPRYVDLNPMLRETETGRLMFGVGITSDAGLTGSVVVDEQNFDWRRFPRSWDDIKNFTAWRGGGQRFRIEAVPGTELQRYVVNFQNPYVFDSRIALGLSAAYYTRRYREYDEQRVGGRVSLGYQFTHDLTGSIAYRGYNITVMNPVEPTPDDLREALGDSVLHGFQARLTYDKRDSAFLATEGHVFDLSFEQVIGTFDYPRVELDARKYFTLYERPDQSGRHVLSLVAKMGITGSNTPIYDHYYAGGFTTLRGFDYRGASPRDLGVTVGGHFRLLFSGEYMFPLTADDMLRLVLFCDAGTVEETVGIDADDFRVSPGLGLRILIPRMGSAPIALDFAFPVAMSDGDDREVFSFFLGWNH